MLEETKVDKTFIKLMDEYRQKVEGKGLLEACSDNIVLFSEKMLGLRLYAWQVLFLTRISKAIHKDFHTKEFVALTSRQIGKSTAVAVLAVWCGVFNKYPGTIHNNTSFGIISASDVQSKKLLYEIKKLMKIGDRHMCDNYEKGGKAVFGKDFFTKLLDDNEPNNTTTLTFKSYNKLIHGDVLLKDSKSGSVIKSYPPTAVVLGETFSVLVEDEAGKSDRITDQFHYDYAYPTGNSTQAIRVYTSTPWVSSGFFFRLADPTDEFEDHPADRVLFTIDAIKLEAPEYYHEVLKTVKQMNRDGRQDEVQRAYYCRFVKGESSYFNPKKVYEAFNYDVDFTEESKEMCDMGVDFGGQVKSKTVITISRLSKDGVIERMFHKIYQVGKDGSLLADMEDLLKRFNVQRIIPDDCPQGDYLIRQMKEKGWNVQPMNFRKDKVKKYGAFRSALNKGKVKSYSDDLLKTEMLALEFSNASKQSLIQHAPGYSDDLIDSFLMSAYFFVQSDEGTRFFNPDELDEVVVPWFQQR